MQIGELKFLPLAKTWRTATRALLYVAALATLCGCGLAGMAMYGAQMEAQGAAQRREGEALARRVEAGDVEAAFACLIDCRWKLRSYRQFPRDPKAFAWAQGIEDQAARLVAAAYEKSADLEHGRRLMHAYPHLAEIAASDLEKRRWHEMTVELANRAALYAQPRVEGIAESGRRALQALFQFRLGGRAGFAPEPDVLRRCDLAPAQVMLRQLEDPARVTREAVCGEVFESVFKQPLPTGYLLTGR